jgi:hypothetical protein
MNNPLAIIKAEVTGFVANKKRENQTRRAELAFRGFHVNNSVVVEKYCPGINSDGRRTVVWMFRILSYYRLFLINPRLAFGCYTLVLLFSLDSSFCYYNAWFLRNRGLFLWTRQWMTSVVMLLAGLAGLKSWGIVVESFRHSKILILKTPNVFTGRYHYNLKKRRWLFWKQRLWILELWTTQ